MTSIGNENPFNATKWLGDFNVSGDGFLTLGKVVFRFRGDGDVAIPDGIVIIAHSAFIDCENITSVTIPNSVTTIGVQAFENCRNLQEIIIPASVTKMADRAFSNCRSLEKVYFLPTTPPEILGEVKGVFTKEGDDANTDLPFYLHGNEYEEGGDWDIFRTYYNNRTIIGTVTTPEGITASGTSTLSHSGIDYYAKDATITLTCSEVPTGYSELLGYTVKDANGDDVTVSEDAGVYTFTMPASDVTVTANWSVKDKLSLPAQQATLNGVTKYWTTFYHPSLSYQLPDGSQAFYVKNDHALYLVGDGSIIPAGCAVIVMSDANSITLTKVSNPDPAIDVTGNILQGTTAATAVTDVYVLSKVGDAFGFFKFEGTIPANKAYYTNE